MLKQLQTTYATKNWVRYATCIGILILGAFLFWVSGGFPPRAWRFLVQVVPQIPHLWMLKGSFILLPLAGLVALSLTLLFVWGFLVVSASWVVAQQWHYLRERRSFEDSLQKAQSLAVNDTFYQQWWQEQTEPIQQVASRATSAKLHFSPTASVATLECEPEPIPASPIQTFSKNLTAIDTVQLASDHCPILLIGTGLDRGIKRKDKPNEDGLLAIQGTLANETRTRPFGLFVIADGMGGHTNGQEASRLAIYRLAATIIPVLCSDVKVSTKGAKELLVDAVQEANLVIYQRNQTYQTNIGTTLAAALVVDTTILIANVGDSRTYLYCEHKGLTRVTQDHSYVARLLASGQIRLDEVYSHPRRNEIYRCLGEKPSVDVDTFVLPLEIGTTLLLCSDGLWEMVRDPDIAGTLRTALPDPSRASRELIQAALDGGGKDNVSAIVVHVT